MGCMLSLRGLYRDFCSPSKDTLSAFQGQNTRPKYSAVMTCNSEDDVQLHG